MRIKLFVLIWSLLLVHLQAMAGELINIRDIASLKPIIAVAIADTQVQRLKSNIQVTAPAILGLYLVIDGTPTTTPVAGEYQLKGNSLIFSPAYSLGGDMDFEVQYKLGQTLAESKRFKTPSGRLSNIVTRAVTAYPLSDTIPYNTLFFHVRFSQPMSPDREAYKHIRVLDEKGTERDRAWRQRSFWLDSGRVLVLMIHPGRVKSGIHHEGPLFDSGKCYKLVVDKAIKDVNGNEIAAEYSQKYFIAGEDRELPKVFISQKKMPAPGTSEALVLSFSEGMDHASVIDGVTLYNGKNVHIPCNIEAIDDSSYRIAPSLKWKKGKYKLVLKSAVYDFAANRIGRPFEIKDVKDVEKDKLDTTIDFEVR